MATTYFPKPVVNAAFKSVGLPKYLDTVPLVMGDTTLDYSALIGEGEDASDLSDEETLALVVAEGSFVQTRSEGFTYVVAASGATDHHLITAGGVKLYVKPDGEQYHVKQFGAIGDGITDDTAALQMAITTAVNAGLRLEFRGREDEYLTTSPIVIPSIPLSLVAGVGSFIWLQGNGCTIKNTATDILQCTNPNGRVRISRINFIGGTGGVARPTITTSFVATYTGTAYLSLGATANGTATFDNISVTETTAGELITNGTFDTNITGWTNVNGGVGAWSSARGRMTVQRVSAASDRVSTSFEIVQGNTYNVVIGYANILGGSNPTWQVGTVPGAADVVAEQIVQIPKGMYIKFAFSGLHIEQCTFTSFCVGLEVDGSNQTKIEQSFFVTNRDIGCSLTNVLGSTNNVSEVLDCIFWAKTQASNVADLMDTCLFIARALNCRVIRNTFEYPQRMGFRGGRIDAGVIESNYFEHGGVAGALGTYDIFLEGSPLYNNVNTRICQNHHSGSSGGGQGSVVGGHHPISVRADWNMFFFGNGVQGYDTGNVDVRYADGTFTAETSTQRFNRINLVGRDDATGITDEDYRLTLDRATIDSQGSYLFERSFELPASTNSDVFEIQFANSFSGVAELLLSHDQYGSELITNGTFDTDIVGWVNVNSGVGTWVAGRLQVERFGNQNHRVATSFSVVAGQEYEVSIGYGGANSSWRIGSTLDGDDIQSIRTIPTGSDVFRFVSTFTGTAYLNLGLTVDGTAEFDDISVRQISGAVGKSYAQYGSTSLAVPTIRNAISSTTIFGTPIAWVATTSGTKLVFSLDNATTEVLQANYSLKLHTLTGQAVGMLCKLTHLL